MFPFGKKKKTQSEPVNTQSDEIENVDESLLTNEEKIALAKKRAAKEDDRIASRVSPFELTNLRYSFYRDGYRNMVKSNLLLAAVCAGSIVWNIVNTVNHEDTVREYFSVDDSGRIIPIHPASTPILTPKQLNYWLIQALSEIYDMTATNYRQVINTRIPQYFTNKGLETYKSALDSANRIQALIDNQLMMSAVPAGTPVIYDQGVISGRYFWRVRIPMRITYQGNGKIATEVRLVNVLITRVNTQQYKDGVAINQLVESEVLTDQQLK